MTPDALLAELARVSLLRTNLQAELEAVAAKRGAL